MPAYLVDKLYQLQKGRDVKARRIRRRKIIPVVKRMMRKIFPESFLICFIFTTDDTDLHRLIHGLAVLNL